MLTGKKWVNRKWKKYMKLHRNIHLLVLIIVWEPYIPNICNSMVIHLSACLLRQLVLSLLVVKNLYSEITNLNNAGRSNCISQGEKDEFRNEREDKTLLFMAYNSASFNYFFKFLKYSSIKAHDSSIWQTISAIFLV